MQQLPPEWNIRWNYTSLSHLIKNIQNWFVALHSLAKWVLPEMIREHRHSAASSMWRTTEGRLYVTIQRVQPNDVCVFLQKYNKHNNVIVSISSSRFEKTSSVDIKSQRNLARDISEQPVCSHRLGLQLQRISAVEAVPTPSGKFGQYDASHTQRPTCLQSRVSLTATTLTPIRNGRDNVAPHAPPISNM